MNKYIATNFLIIFALGVFGGWVFNYIDRLENEVKILRVQYNSIAYQLSGDYEIISFMAHKKTRTHKPPRVQEDDGKFNYLDEEI